MSNAILGIDVSKNELSTCLLLDKSSIRHTNFANNNQGHRALNQYLKKQIGSPINICLEATGKYGYEVSDYLHKKGHIVKVINPLAIKSFAKAKLSRHKTDKVDAAIIAEYGSKFDSISYRPITKKRSELKELYRCSLSVREQITYCSNHLENKELLPDSVILVWQDIEAKLKDKESDILQRIRVLIKGDRLLKKQFNDLITIPGIAEKTAIAILAELANFEHFKSARQLAAFIGLTPKHRESGSSVFGKSRISKMGLSKLRKALFFPAMAAIRSNEYFGKIAKKLEDKNKAKKAAICAIMRRLVHIIFGVLRNGEKFDITRLEKNKNLSAQTVIAP